MMKLRRTVPFLLLLLLTTYQAANAQCTAPGTQSGANCTRSGAYYGEMLPNNGCGVFRGYASFGPGQYFRMPVLPGACYDVSTCGATIDTQVGVFQGLNTTGPYAWNDDNGPSCGGLQASVNFVPNFNDYVRVQVSQYNCLPGGTSSITVRVRQNNNLSITSSGADMCAGDNRTLTATPTAVTPFNGNAGDGGTFSGTGVSGTSFTAPTPGATSQVYAITYTYGYCSTTQNITVWRDPVGSINTASQTICTNSLPISANETYGTGQWSTVTPGVTFGDANDPNTTVNNLPQGTPVTLTWTVTNGGACTTPSVSNITVTYAGPSGTWIGGTSTAWSNGANWCGGVPINTTDVIIPDAGTTSFDPHVDATTAVCHDITLNANALLYVDAGQTLTVYSDFTNNSGNPANVSSHNTSTVAFTSFGANINGNTATTFGNLNIDGSVVGITLSQPVTVTNVLTMNSNMDLQSGLTLGTAPTNTGAITVGAGRFMSGPSYFTRYFNASTNSGTTGLFPVSDGTNLRYAQFEYTGAPSTGGSISTRFVSTALTLFTGLPLMDAGVNVNNYMDEGYWDVTTGGGLTGGTYTLTLNYNGITTVNTPADLRIIKSPGPAHTTWVADGTHGGATGSTVSRTGMSGFSFFVIGGEAPTNPLPVQLVSFDAECENGMVNLSWVTASEQNNQYFSLESSTDGITWNEVARVNGAGNSNTMRNYSYTDENPAKGSSYYRLTQVDYDGESETFEPINIHCVQFGNNSMMMYPNPTEGGVTLSITLDKEYGPGIVMVSDMMGKGLIRQNINLEQGENKFILNGTDGLISGTYMVFNSG